MLLRFVVGFAGRTIGLYALVVRPCVLGAQAVRDEGPASVADGRTGILAYGAFGTSLVVVQEESGRRKAWIDASLSESPDGADGIGRARVDVALWVDKDRSMSG